MSTVSRESQIKNGGSWLYWVAGMSAINFVAQLANWGFSFSIGLGLSSVVGAVASGGNPGLVTIGSVFTGFLIVLLAALGYFACQGHVWAFIVGLVILVSDTVLLFMFAPTAILSIAFHAWAVWCLISGMRAAARP